MRCEFLDSLQALKITHLFKTKFQPKATLAGRTRERASFRFYFSKPQSVPAQDDRAQESIASRPRPEAAPGQNHSRRRNKPKQPAPKNLAGVYPPSPSRPAQKRHRKNYARMSAYFLLSRHSRCCHCCKRQAVKNAAALPIK